MLLPQYGQGIVWSSLASSGDSSISSFCESQSSSLSKARFIQGELNLIERRQYPRLAVLGAGEVLIGVFVIFEGVGRGVEVEDAAGAPGAVAEVAEEAGGVSDGFKVGVGSAAGAHAVGEILGVGQVVVAGGFFFDELAFGVIGPPTRVADNDVAVVATDGSAFGLFVQRIGVPDAHLVCEQIIGGEVVRDHHCIGPF